MDLRTVIHRARASVTLHTLLSLIQWSTWPSVGRWVGGLGREEGCDHVSVGKRPWGSRTPGGVSITCQVGGPALHPQGAGSRLQGRSGQVGSHGVHTRWPARPLSSPAGRVRVPVPNPLECSPCLPHPPSCGVLPAQGEGLWNSLQDDTQGAGSPPKACWQAINKPSGSLLSTQPEGACCCPRTQTDRQAPDHGLPG